MPELNIERQHSLGLEGARLVAERWREQAEQDWGIVMMKTGQTLQDGLLTQ